MKPKPELQHDSIVNVNVDNEGKDNVNKPTGTENAMSGHIYKAVPRRGINTSIDTASTSLSASMSTSSASDSTSGSLQKESNLSSSISSATASPRCDRAITVTATKTRSLSMENPPSTTPPQSKSKLEDQSSLASVGAQRAISDLTQAQKKTLTSSWSMLELSEISIIHKLKDDMEDILSLGDDAHDNDGVLRSLANEEAAPASFTNRNRVTDDNNDSGNDNGDLNANANKNVDILKVKSKESPRKSGFMPMSTGLGKLASLNEENDHVMFKVEEDDEFFFYDSEDDQEVDEKRFENVQEGKQEIDEARSLSIVDKGVENQNGHAVSSTDTSADFTSSNQRIRFTTQNASSPSLGVGPTSTKERVTLTTRFKGSASRNNSSNLEKAIKPKSNRKKDTSKSKDASKSKIKEDKTKKKQKFKKHIFNKIGMKKSVSMSMFSLISRTNHGHNHGRSLDLDSSRDSSIDVSYHRKGHTLDLDLEDETDEDAFANRKNNEYADSEDNIDVSHHRRFQSLDLRDIDDLDAKNVNNDVDNSSDVDVRESLDDSSQYRCRNIVLLDPACAIVNKSEQKIAASPSPSPNSIVECIENEDSYVKIDTRLNQNSAALQSTRPLSLTTSPPDTIGRQSSADALTLNLASTSTEFKHCPKKKPVQSILRKTNSMRKATSMLDFNSFSSQKLQKKIHTNASPKSDLEATKSALRSSTESPQKKNMKRITSFSTLEIREYQITIGDNPGGRNGPPISLDWDYCKRRTVKMCIDKYEETRPPRRARHEMYMSGSIRMWTLLKELGYSLREIDAASKSADLVRKKRQKSIRYKDIYDLQYKVGKIMRRGSNGATSTGTSSTGTSSSCAHYVVA